MRTLVVEDDPAQRDVMVGWLAEMGWPVTSVGDGNAGLLAHLRSPFELIVLDWVMPGMDGLQLCRRIRSLPGGDAPYILMVTGRDRSSDLSEVLDAGADDYLAKPTTIEVLRTRVRIAETRVQRDRRHREAQEALAQSEADFRRVIERSSVGVLAHRDGRIVYLNAAGLTTLGGDREAIIGRPLVDFVGEGFREVARRRASRFERTQVPPPPIEMEMARVDGSTVIARIVPATGAVYQGERACFSLLEDVTQQRAAAHRLRMTQFAVDHAADAALWIRDDDGIITYANQAAGQMSGYEPHELIGRHVLELHTRMGVTDWPKVQRMFHRSSPARHRMSIRSRSGVAVPVEYIANVADFDGERIVIVFARDISERQRMEASLQQADRLASVGSLAAGVAHEINNPLAYVIANLELLAEDLERGGVSAMEVKQTVAEATEGAHRVRRIVSDLKSFARADDDELGPVQVHEVLDVAIDIASNEIRHRASLVREYGQVPPTWANSGRLTQVFLNLLVNAAQAIPEGTHGQVISVTTREVDGWVEIEIADTGDGIDLEIIDRIFDPFFSTKPQGVGTGLGLSICHGIVTGMGGEITVKSRPGEGSRFRLRLPPVEADKPRRRRTPSEWRAVAPGAQLGRRMSILVIDDEPILCEGIRKALLGHDVAIAASGTEGVQACERGSFDLVLCDVMMPDLSGMEVFEQVQSQRPSQAARFVFMTGGAFTPKAREFLERVENERIIKPFSLRELRSLVARWASAPVHLTPLR